MHNIKIGSRNIGEGRPCFIIAEAGSNHNRKLDLAFQLIDIAKESGADAVKFQSFKADKHYPKIKSNKPGKSSYEITKNKELPEEWIPKLSRYCKERDILFMSSVFYDEAVDILNPYVSVFKIASSEMTHYPLIQYAHGTGKPLIISTGMADLSEVNGLVDMLEGLKMNKP
ncbi:MAG: N-acetylneuraminate synthase family protein, partial [Candidatus Omnitrophica bacterium]|nr:N-acetylneuraminate synthase family protein [Candidatus Omnitrophota bacterium]